MSHSRFVSVVWAWSVAIGFPVLSTDRLSGPRGWRDRAKTRSYSTSNSTEAAPAAVDPARAALRPSSASTARAAGGGPRLSAPAAEALAVLYHIEQRSFGCVYPSHARHAKLWPASSVTFVGCAKTATRRAAPLRLDRSIRQLTHRVMTRSLIGDAPAPGHVRPHHARPSHGQSRPVAPPGRRRVRRLPWTARLVAYSHYEYVALEQEHRHE